MTGHQIQNRIRARITTTNQNHSSNINRIIIQHLRILIVAKATIQHLRRVIIPHHQVQAVKHILLLHIRQVQTEVVIRRAQGAVVVIRVQAAVGQVHVHPEAVHVHPEAVLIQVVVVTEGNNHLKNVII